VMHVAKNLFRRWLRPRARRTEAPPSINAPWTVAGDVRATRSDEGAALLQIGAGRVFKLNRSGADIWTKLARQETTREIARALASQHGGVAAEFERHVAAFACRLAALGLLIEGTEVQS